MNFERWFAAQRDEFNVLCVQFLSEYSLLEQAENNSLEVTYIEDNEYH